MANRICIISFCDKCPYFDNEYYGYAETCTKLNRKIKRNDNCRFTLVKHTDPTYVICTKCGKLYLAKDLEKERLEEQAKWDNSNCSWMTRE